MSFACNADVVFSISVLTLNFSCLLHSLLSFTPRGEKVPISYFIFRFILRRPFGMWQGAECHQWLSLLHETTDYFKTFFSLSPSINPKQCCCKGKSFLPDLHLLCPLQKPLFSLAPHSVTLSAPVLWFSIQHNHQELLVSLRNLKFLDNTVSVRSSIIQGRWLKGRCFLLPFINVNYPLGVFVTYSFKLTPLCVAPLKYFCIQIEF